MNDIGLRRRRALRWILVLAAVALLAVGATQPWGVSAVPLELAPSALHFRRILLDDWAAGVAAADITGFQRLRANLLADSLLLVPAYVALLVFFTLAYGPSPQRHPALRQWLCVPAVVAGLFDIAENSMTGRALDELMHSSLSDATVADIHPGQPAEVDPARHRAVDRRLALPGRRERGLAHRRRGRLRARRAGDGRGRLVCAAAGDPPRRGRHARRAGPAGLAGAACARMTGLGRRATACRCGRGIAFPTISRRPPRTASRHHRADVAAQGRTRRPSARKPYDIRPAM